MKTILLSAALLATSTGAAQPDAVTCRRADVLVALARGEPAEFLVAGELCASERELRSGKTVQLLIHGATYNHDYWDFGTIDGVTYSYAREVAARGIATFDIDQIGTGGSSHPPSNLVTIDAAAYVAHQLVHALRDGTVGGAHFDKVIVVGHSLGSVVAWEEAIRYADVDGVIVTGAAHSLPKSFYGSHLSAFQSAVADPRFMKAGLDPGYLTTVPGLRAGLFSPAFIPEDEQHKDVVSATEVATAIPTVASTATLAIQVPVLTILGSNDLLACGQEAQGHRFNCSSGVAVATEEAPFYSKKAQIHACVIPGAGHDLNLTRQHELEVSDVVAWSGRFVDRRLAGNYDTRHHDPERKDDLPANCGAAVGVS